MIFRERKNKPKEEVKRMNFIKIGIFEIQLTDSVALELIKKIKRKK